MTNDQYEPILRHSAFPRAKAAQPRNDDAFADFPTRPRLMSHPDASLVTESSAARQGSKAAKLEVARPTPVDLRIPASHRLDNCSVGEP